MGHAPWADCGHLYCHGRRRLVAQTQGCFQCGAVRVIEGQVRLHESAGRNLRHGHRARRRLNHDQNGQGFGDLAGRLPRPVITGDALEQEARGTHLRRIETAAQMRQLLVKLGQPLPDLLVAAQGSAAG